MLSSCFFIVILNVVVPRIFKLSTMTPMSVASVTRAKSFNTNCHQKTLKLAVYKKEETKVEEIRDEEKSLEEEYESNMRPINEKLDSKTMWCQWKGINLKQSARWQKLSRLKACAFFSFQKKLVVMKHSNLYLGLVMPSGE